MSQISTKESIGNALFTRRKKLGLSQAELARLSEVSSSSWIGAIERGQQTISIGKLDSLLKGLKTNLLDLLLEHSALTQNPPEIELNKDQLECWNTIKELNPEQVKLLNAILKLIKKHSEQTPLKISAHKGGKLRLAKGPKKS